MVWSSVNWIERHMVEVKILSFFIYFHKLKADTNGKFKHEQSVKLNQLRKNSPYRYPFRRSKQVSNETREERATLYIFIGLTDDAGGEDRQMTGESSGR